jgi:hypothetical protein
LLMLLSLPCLRRSPPAIGRLPVATGGGAPRGAAAGMAPLEAPRAGGGALPTRSCAVFGVDCPPGAEARRDGVAVLPEAFPYCTSPAGLRTVIRSPAGCGRSSAPRLHLRGAVVNEGDRCVYCDRDSRCIMLLRELLARRRKATGLAEAA